MAEHIAGARLVELEGADHLPWVGDAESVLGEMEEFLTGDRHVPAPQRVLATLLFTDIVESTRTAAALGDRRWKTLLETHDAVVRAELKRFHGREVKTTGDGFLAVFDGPARAVRCGLALIGQLRRLSVDVRAGVHTGEVELADGDVHGLGVHVAARVMSLAGPDELLVSSVVRDLSVGSGLAFADRGRHMLKGVPEQWRLFAASLGPAAR